MTQIRIALIIIAYETNVITILTIVSNGDMVDCQLGASFVLFTSNEHTYMTQITGVFKTSDTNFLTCASVACPFKKFVPIVTH
jgi:hypothetical protein